MKMKTAIFDLDGTLLNTLGDLCDSVNCAIVPRGFPAVDEELTRQRVGNGVRRLVERCIPEEKRTEAMIDECLDDFRTAYNERMMNRTQPYDGIVDMLKKLREQGVSIGVMSNKYDFAAKALVRHYFGDLVQLTLGERPGIPRKPDPTSTLELMHELGGVPETTLYIGDSSTDMQTAGNAGLTAVGVMWGFRSPEELEETGASVLVAEPAELLPLFERGLLNVDALSRAFTSRGFAFSYFPTANEAARYIASACAGKSVSLGGSMTFKEMGFPEAFADSTEVHWHWITKGEYYQTPDIYLTSANALSESGEAVNIAWQGRCTARSSVCSCAASTSCVRISRVRSSGRAMSPRRRTRSVLARERPARRTANVTTARARRASAVRWWCIWVRRRGSRNARSSWWASRSAIKATPRLVSTQNLLVSRSCPMMRYFLKTA